MPSLTDGAIRHAIKRVEKRRKQTMLSDGEGRGTGRLVLILKPMPTRVTAEWMAQQWRDGRRIKSKIGGYPAMSLSDAREIFKRDFSGVILTKRSIKVAGDTRPGTVGDLFEGYVRHLKDSGKPSWAAAEKGLNKIADTLGRNRPAREIMPEDVLAVIRPSMRAALGRWPTTSAVMFAPRTRGPSSRSTTTAIHRLDASSSWSIRRRVSRPNQKSSAPDGWTRTNSCDCIGGSNTQTPRCIRLTRELFAFSCSPANASRRSRG